MIACSVLTATAVGLGVGFMFKANAAKDDAEAARARAVQGADPDRIANDSYCVDGIPNRSPACDDLTEKVDEWNTARSIAAGSFIAAGAIGLSTAAAYFFWPDKSPSADRRARIRITPVIGSSQRGLSAELSF